jgi:hypothetical protein
MNKNKIMEIKNNDTVVSVVIIFSLSAFSAFLTWIAFNYF